MTAGRTSPVRAAHLGGAGVCSGLPEAIALVDVPLALPRA